MQPILRTATSALRQAGSASSGTSSNASRVAAAAASSISSQRSIASRNGHGHAYATQAGMPMPPAPPGDSGGKSDKKATKAQSAVASKNSKAAATSSTAEPVVGVNASDPPVAPAQDGAAEPPAVPPAPEEVLPPTSSGREIKPVSSLASQYLDATEIPASAAERTGARSTSGKRPLSSIEKKRRNLGRATLAAMAVGSGIFAWNLGREWDSEKEKERLGRNVTIEAGMEGRWQRGQTRFWDTLDYFNKPAWDPLLPEPLKPPHQKPYTLLLSLDDLLINSSWSREHGWRTAKRPGLDYFLAYLSQFYEIVIFTSQPSYTAAPIVEKLDPYMLYVLYRLFRESTRYSKELKDVVKDLSYLGRDLSKVILLDTVPAHFASQPENAIAMKPWDGNRADTDLVGMIPFLEAIAIYQVPDVRPILKNYAGKHIPSAWAEVEAEQKRAALAEYEASGAGKKGKLGGGFGSLFGVSNPQVRHDTGAPKTQLELGREFYQKAYLEEQKWWAEHKPEIEKAMEEDRQKQMQQATSSLTNYMSTFFGMPLPPKAEEAAATPAQNATPVPNQTR